MTNKEIEKYEQELTKLSKALDELRTVQDAGERYPRVLNLYQRLQTLAANIPAPLSNANMLNTDMKIGKGITVAVESNCGELINNIHRALQTKIMFNACVLAKWSCFWAAIAAIASCISVLLVLFCA